MTLVPSDLALSFHGVRNVNWNANLKAGHASPAKVPVKTTFMEV